MIIKFEDIAELRQVHKKSRTVFFDGVFDMFHLGHLTALQSLSTYGDVVIVGIMSDEWVKDNKGDFRPIMNQSERAAIVDSIKGVNYVLILENKVRLKTSEVLKALTPDVFVTSDSMWSDKFSDLGFGEIELQIVDRKPSDIQSNIHPPSTTDLIKYIKGLD